jgi:hypothetical protein
VKSDRSRRPETERFLKSELEKLVRSIIKGYETPNRHEG